MLSTETVERNTDLEAKVAALEIELAVWKNAHIKGVSYKPGETPGDNVSDPS